MNRPEDFLDDAPGEAPSIADRSLATALRRATDGGSGVRLSAAVRGRLRRRTARRAVTALTFGLALCVGTVVMWGGLQSDGGASGGNEANLVADKDATPSANTAQIDPTEAPAIVHATDPEPSTAAENEVGKAIEPGSDAKPLQYAEVVSELRELTATLGVSALTVRSTEKNGLEFAARFADEESLSGVRNGAMLAALGRIIRGYDHVSIEMSAGEIVRLSMLILPPQHFTIEVEQATPDYPSNRR